MNNQIEAIPEVELRDLFELFKRDTLMAMNCQAIGTIQKFNVEKQTCEVKISYDKKYLEPNEFGINVPVAKPYPLLVDVPVINLYGGDAGLTFPIKKGDKCILLFNDRDIDNWFEGKEEGFVRTSRLHSLTDGFAIVGIRNKKNFIANYDATRASLFNGTTTVSVGPDKILIANETATLNTLLQELVTAIKDIKTIDTIPNGNQVPQSLQPTSITAIEQVGTKIQELLE